MTIFLSPCICTLIMIIIENLRKCNHNPLFYIRIFFIVLGCNLLFSYCEGSEFNMSAEVEIASFQHYDAYNDHQVKHFKEKLSYHTKEGQRSFRDAEKICLLIPDISDRDIAKSLFKNALILSLSAKDSWAGIIISLTNMCCDYGLCVYDQWSRMEYHLNESKYHFEMMDFYKDVLART